MTKHTDHSGRYTGPSHNDIFNHSFYEGHIEPRRTSVVLSGYLGEAGEKLESGQRDAHVESPLRVESLGEQVDTADQQPGRCVCVKSWDIKHSTPHAAG